LLEAQGKVAITCSCRQLKYIVICVKEKHRDGGEGEGEMNEGREGGGERERKNREGE